MSMDSQGDVAEVSLDPPVGHYDPDEIVRLITNLPEDDLALVIGMDRKFIGGTGRQDGELFREVIVRAAQGKRRCPRDVDPVRFVVKAMESIASHDRAQLVKVRPFDEAVAHDPGNSTATLILPDALADPEQALLAKEEVDEDDVVLARIKGALAGDEQCELMLLGWSNDYRGKELRDLIGCDQERVSYLAKKVRRAADKLYPERRVR